MLEEAKQHEAGDAELDDLAERIEAALTIHAQLEEKLFYPELRDRSEDEEGRIDVFEGFTEHDVVKHLIALLRGRRRNEEQFKAQLQVLGENVRHHVQEEESTIFKLAQQLLDEQEREEIGERWQRAKMRAQSAGAGGGRKTSGRKKTAARKKTGARKSTGGRSGGRGASAGGRKKTAGGKKSPGRKKTAGRKKTGSRR